MAYIRWSSPGHPWPYDSDVYVFLSTGGGVECCACCLERGGDDLHFRAWSAVEILVHLAEHLDAGHAVPDEAFERIAADAETIDAECRADLERRGEL